VEQPSESEEEEESVRLPLNLIETNLDGFPPEVVSGKTISHQAKEEEKQPVQKVAQKSRVAMQKQGGLLKIDVTAANLAESNVVMPQGGLNASPGKMRIKLEAPPTTNEGLMAEIGVELQKKRVGFFMTFIFRFKKMKYQNMTQYIQDISPSRKS
jgi:hypothetical protein